MRNQQREAREDLLKKTDEELRTLMMQALALEDIDIEFINCITDILATRHPEEYVFNEEGILDAALQVGEQEAAEEPCESRPPKGKRRSRTLQKMLAVAAVLVVVMMAGFAIPVRGTNLFGIIAHWTSELFSFGSSEIGKTEQNNMIEEASEDSLVLYNLLLDNGITTPLAPTYIPKDFTIQKLVEDLEDAETIKYCAEFINEVNNIIFISIWISDPVDMVVEKDESNITIYTVDQIDHYIFFNIDSMSVTWRNGIYDCSISIFGDSITEAQVYAMIDSIYGNGE